MGVEDKGLSQDSLKAAPPTETGAQKRSCLAFKANMYCTLELGHRGNHIAGRAISWPSDESDEPEPSEDLHPYSVEVLRVLGVHDIPATSEEDAVVKVALWMHKGGQMTAELQDAPQDIVLYLKSISEL